MVTTCSCGAEILWVVSERGKHMPLSVKSAERRVVVLPSSDPAQGRIMLTYLSHFADCPDAANFRKSKAG